MCQVFFIDDEADLSFALLCPTCHRVEHARIKVAAKKNAS